jgi:RNA polymerase sigma-70 factor (ECF subfamily)
MLETALMPTDFPSEDRRGPDAALVERARAGDAAAFEQIIVRSQRRVFSTAWRLLGTKEDAQDAAQEVFLRAYRYLGGFDTRQDLAAWLHQITVNVCRDIARKRGPGSAVHASLETERELGTIEALASGADAEADAIRAQERAMVTRAIADLPEKERAAIVLRDIEGLTTEEVARALGSRPATVRSQLCSARAKIKRYCDRILGTPQGEEP